MLQRARWTWHARASISRTQSLPRWNLLQQRCLATNTPDGDLQPDEHFDEHEYYEAAEDVEGHVIGRHVGPSRRNITAMGTVVVQNPDPSKLGDLISQIQPTNMGRPSLPNIVPSCLLLLLTPALAQHALSTDLPLQVLQQLGENPTASKPLDAITAVVDRLPAPGSSRKGEQGLGYHFTTSPWASVTSAQVPLQSSTQKPGSLTFNLPALAGWSDCEPSLQLPLAQTVFSVGLPSTLIHMRYEFDPLSGLLRKSSSQRLESQAVRTPIRSKDTRLLFDCPLLPLTPLRRVVNSMGNIVRKVSDKIYRHELPGKGKTWSSQDSQPASEELEAAVNDYFSLNKLTPEPVQVWALVVPRHAFEDFTFSVRNTKNGLRNRSQFLEYNQTQLQDMWVGRENVPAERKIVTARNVNRELKKLIGKGARLCQVLSGGGGWGKKAGLISLDPDTAYHTRDLRAEDGWAFDFDESDADGSFKTQQRQALGDIVREGDGVMLFLAKKTPNEVPFPPGQDDRGSKSLTFGVVPSSIDELQDQIVGQSNAESEQHIRHYPNDFGMLSEGGMALTLTRDGRPVTQTKLDVPLEQIFFTNSKSKREEIQSRTTTDENTSTRERTSLTGDYPNEPLLDPAIPIRKVHIDKRTQSGLRPRGST